MPRSSELSRAGGHRTRRRAAATWGGYPGSSQSRCKTRGCPRANNRIPVGGYLLAAVGYGFAVEFNLFGYALAPHDFSLVRGPAAPERCPSSDNGVAANGT